MNVLPLLLRVRIWCKEASLTTEQACFLCFGNWDDARQHRWFHASLLTGTLQAHNRDKLEAFIRQAPQQVKVPIWMRDKRMNRRSKLPLTPGKHRRARSMSES